MTSSKDLAAGEVAANNLRLAAEQLRQTRSVIDDGSRLLSELIVGTSTTSLTTGLGDKTLTTQAGKAFGVGSRVSLTNTAARVMHGAVTAYDGTSLTVAVDRVFGSGTAADWTIRLAGLIGENGDQGIQGVQGVQGVQGLKGDTGAKGDTGSQGVQGVKGDTGAKGDTGDRGLQGLKGDKGDPGASAIGYEARSANTQIVAADQAKLIDLTGTFTQAFASPAALGAGWWCEVRNNDQGDITIPASDGRTNWIMYPGEHRRFFVAGGVLRSIVLKPFAKTFVQTGTFVPPPGYAWFDLMTRGSTAGGSGGSHNANSAARFDGGGAASAYTLWFPKLKPSRFPNTGDAVQIGAAGAAGVNGSPSSPNGTSGERGGSTIVAGISTPSSNPGTPATTTANGVGGDRFGGENADGFRLGFANNPGAPGATSIGNSAQVFEGSGAGGRGGRGTSTTETIVSTPTDGSPGQVKITGVI